MADNGQNLIKFWDFLLHIVYRFMQKRCLNLWDYNNLWSTPGTQVCTCSIYRHRSALGECVASFASTFPVAFLEPQFNKHNRNSILFGIDEDSIATHSLEAKGKFESSIFKATLCGHSQLKNTTCVNASVWRQPLFV